MPAPKKAANASTQQLVDTHTYMPYLYAFLLRSSIRQRSMFILPLILYSWDTQCVGILSNKEGGVEGLRCLEVWSFSHTGATRINLQMQNYSSWHRQPSVVACALNNLSRTLELWFEDSSFPHDVIDLHLGLICAIDGRGRGNIQCQLIA